MSAPTMTYIVRGKVNANNEWVDQQILFNPPADSYRVSADHYGSRFLFDGKGHFFWSMGERHDYQMSQNLASPLGKIHRLNDDGSIPKDNPFVHTPGALGSIWTYGHRNPEGLDFDPATGLVFSSNGESGTLTIAHEDSPSKFTVLQQLKTADGARTMELDPKSHRVYLVTADRTPGTPTAASPRPRPVPVPGTFRLMVLGR